MCVGIFFAEGEAWAFWEERLCWLTIHHHHQQHRHTKLTDGPTDGWIFWKEKGEGKKCKLSHGKNEWKMDGDDDDDRPFSNYIRIYIACSLAGDGVGECVWILHTIFIQLYGQQGWMDVFLGKINGRKEREREITSCICSRCCSSVLCRQSKSSIPHHQHPPFSSSLIVIIIRSNWSEREKRVC